MTDIQTSRQTAIETMRAPPEVESKLNALDALDRLALNPSGWFPETLLRKLDDARIAIIVDRWTDALVTLEDAYTSIEEFVDVVSKASGEKNAEERTAAIARAKDELAQCAKVQRYVGVRVASLS